MFQCVIFLPFFIQNNPAYLPLDSVLEMLIEVSESGKAQFEADAVVAMGNFAVAVTRMADEDAALECKVIQRLLHLLLSSKSSSRIAAVQVCGGMKNLMSFRMVFHGVTFCCLLGSQHSNGASASFHIHPGTALALPKAAFHRG